EALEGDLLQQPRVVPDRTTPFLVVVGPRDVVADRPAADLPVVDHGRSITQLTWSPQRTARGRPRRRLSSKACLSDPPTARTQKVHANPDTRRREPPAHSHMKAAAPLS